MGAGLDHANAQFSFNTAGQAMCGGSAEIVLDIEDCCTAGQKLNKVFGGAVDVDYEPAGCYSKGTTHIYFNWHTGGANQSQGTQRVCKQHTNTPQLEPFRLQWLGDSAG